MLSEPYLNEQKELKTMWGGKNPQMCPTTDHRTVIQWEKKSHLYVFPAIFYNIIDGNVTVHILLVRYQTRSIIGQQFRETKVALCTVSTEESGDPDTLYVTS